MEDHVSWLQSLCRVCGGKIKTSAGYIRAKKFEDYIDLLDIYVPNENENIYPKLLCNTCKKKLDKKKTGKNIEIKLATFMPHSEEDCGVCSKKQQQRRGKSIVPLHANNLDQAFQKIGFLKFSVSTHNIYFKPMEGRNYSVNSSICISVQPDGHWNITANGNDIPDKCKLLPVYDTINDDNVSDFCHSIVKLSMCEGIKDFQDVINARLDFRNPFPDLQGGNAAWVESSTGNVKLLKDNFDIIRSRQCHFLIESENKSRTCEGCVEFRKNLFVYRARSLVISEQQEARIAQDSTTNFRYLQVSEMEKRLKNLAKTKKDAVQMASRYAVRIEKLIEQKGVNVGEDQNDLFKTVLENNPTDFEEGTPQKLLWQQQIEQSKKSNSRSMRWHPLIIRWCLSIYHTSPAAYRHISSKRNNFLVLPHINTLKRYINFTSPSSGFNQDIIEQLCVDSNIESIPEFQKNVSLLFDEIKIKSGLTYRRSTGQLIGFTEMGELNEEISLFQRNLDNDDDQQSPREFASYCNVFMVRGICSSLCYPFGYHASNGMTSDQLFVAVWEATHVLESVGFKVRAWVCDGASPNRKLFKINEVDIYWTWNFFDMSRKIYFISDAPHLIKTTRNNLENSHGNRNSRNLKFNGHDVSWMHIVSVYEWDLGLNPMVPGLRHLHKLTEDHIRLTPRNRMKVKFAVNVLSNSVACAVERQGKLGRESTIKFIKIFDRAFDCLNVVRLKGGGKKDRMPYNSIDDPRFEFLESVIEFLDQWRKEIDQQPDITQEEKNRFCLSQQTDIGWRITIQSFVELCRLLLLEDGVKYILSEKFSQDPLEEHFARHRRSAGCNENPTMSQFQQQEIALNLIKSPLIGDLRGNTSGKKESRQPLDTSDSRLPRRKDPKKAT